MSAIPETTGSQRADLATRFQPGNPGRPKGSKNKLAEDFVADMHEAWQASGKAAIEAMIADKPGDFVKTVAALIPKDVNFNINDHSELTDEQLAERIRALATQLAPFLTDGTGAAAIALAGADGPKLIAGLH